MYRPSLVFAVLAFALVILGAFLPWVSTGLVTRSGVEGDGAFTLTLAVLGVACLLIARSSFPCLGAAALGAIISGIAVVDLIEVAKQEGGFDMASTFLELEVSPGPGLVLTILAGAVAAFASLAYAGSFVGLESPRFSRLRSYECSACGAPVLWSEAVCASCGAAFENAVRKPRYRRIR